ncbi:secreted RxLR effector protein 161-like [Nicotiana tabacum]|uniref:Secreted RxLR effector protein 161-like n=1 Tax=Nicotiana tabacum TaxID=4097 RepID=A0A1S3YGQ6_TOBAC|nr:PREDICTED: uncharacterized mitochondrial protein AtMg00810-like [Nicotiana tabacum]
MENSKTIDTPIATAAHLDMDELGSSVNETMYRGIIGSLLYLTTSRPDIVFSMGLCVRFQSSPKESHMKAAKRILRYLKGTHDMVLYYPSGDNFDLIGYGDAHYVGYLVDRKSTYGMTHFLGSYFISWGTRNKTLMLFQLRKLRMWQLPLAVLNCCGSSSNRRTLVYFLIVFHYCVIKHMLFQHGKEPDSAKENKSH